jgi:hypothetical protein
MGFIRGIANATCLLIGAAAWLGGVFVFVWGILEIITGNVKTGILLIVISIFSVAIGTGMLKYAYSG